MTDAELRERLHAQCDYLLDQAADRLEALANKLQRMEEALEDCRRYVTQYGTSQPVRALHAKIDAALKD